MKYIKVVPDPTIPACYINADMITEISVSYDDYRQMLLSIHIHTVNGSYEHFAGRKMSKDDVDNFIEKIICSIQFDTRDMGNIIDINNRFE